MKKIKDTLTKHNTINVEMLYIANVGEDEIGDEDNDKVKAIREYAAKEDSEVIVISAKSKKKSHIR